MTGDSWGPAEKVSKLSAVRVFMITQPQGAARYRYKYKAFGCDEKAETDQSSKLSQKNDFHFSLGIINTVEMFVLEKPSFLVFHLGFFPLCFSHSWSFFKLFFVIFFLVLSFFCRT